MPAKKPAKRRSGAPRDSQVGKLYASEAFAWCNAVRGTGEHYTYTTGELPTDEAAQAFLDETLAHPAIRATFGRSACAKVSAYYAGRGASASYTTGRIRLGTEARSKVIALHELAHVIAGRYFGWELIEAHGPQFAAVQLYLIRVMCGDAAADNLRASYELHGVRFVKMWEPALTSS